MKVIKKVYPTGDISYYNEHGLWHREDGPAMVSLDGFKVWWINGKKHREDGPAIIWSNGDKSYWLDNIRYSYEEWLKLIPNSIMIKWREFCESN